MKTNTVLQQAVLDAATKAGDQTGWRLLQGLGPMVAILNLPLALVLGLSGIVGEAYSRHQDLSEARMPDDWLAQVANAPEVSQKGLVHLAKCLADAGFISVKDAMDWLAIEEEVAHAKQVQNEQQLSGAQALLARAKKECGSLLDPGIVDRAAGALKTVAQYAPGVMSIVAGVIGKKK